MLLTTTPWIWIYIFTWPESHLSINLVALDFSIWSSQSRYLSEHRPLSGSRICQTKNQSELANTKLTKSNSRWGPFIVIGINALAVTRNIGTNNNYMNRSPLTESQSSKLIMIGCTTKGPLLSMFPLSLPQSSGRSPSHSCTCPSHPFFWWWHLYQYHLGHPL